VGVSGDRGRKRRVAACAGCRAGLECQIPPPAGPCPLAARGGAWDWSNAGPSTAQTSDSAKTRRDQFDERATTDQVATIGFDDYEETAPQPLGRLEYELAERAALQCEKTEAEE
jgi:hypothetical protein